MNIKQMRKGSMRSEHQEHPFCTVLISLFFIYLFFFLDIVSIITKKKKKYRRTLIKSVRFCVMCLCSPPHRYCQFESLKFSQWSSTKYLTVPFPRIKVSIVVYKFWSFLSKKWHLLNYSQETASEENPQHDKRFPTDHRAQVNNLDREQNLGTTAMWRRCRQQLQDRNLCQVEDLLINDKETTFLLTPLFPHPPPPSKKKKNCLWVDMNEREGEGRHIRIAMWDPDSWPKMYQRRNQVGGCDRRPHLPPSCHFWHNGFVPSR